VITTAGYRVGPSEIEPHADETSGGGDVGGGRNSRSDPYRNRSRPGFVFASGLCHLTTRWAARDPGVRQGAGSQRTNIRATCSSPTPLPMTATGKGAAARVAGVGVGRSSNLAPAMRGRGRIASAMRSNRPGAIRGEGQGRAFTPIFRIRGPERPSPQPPSPRKERGEGALTACSAKHHHPNGRGVSRGTTKPHGVAIPIFLSASSILLRRPPS